ncbi:hypothetical protein L596_017730 [Steinernema carpocapsae]|uniref:Uncharacterized protein n=1 Tax=Steinernema carpocapsae TaxID=34508 RepID=A0A4U5N2I6_STECR|nr:hypothetical protein L596_017730 [Steinernema carpocapsae]
MVVWEKVFTGKATSICITKHSRCVNEPRSIFYALKKNVVEYYNKTDMPMMSNEECMGGVTTSICCCYERLPRSVSGIPSDVLLLSLCQEQRGQHEVKGSPRCLRQPRSAWFLRLDSDVYRQRSFRLGIVLNIA